MSRFLNTYVFCVILVPCYSLVDVVSIENPLNNALHCVKLQVMEGVPYDPDVDHLLEDGCKYPVRQNNLERDFEDVVFENIASDSVWNKTRMIAEKGLMDWQTFKRNHLEIPDEFFNKVGGYAFVENINPVCSQDNILFVRVCFWKNPTRRFGRPDFFQSSDGTLFQIRDDKDGRYLSSSDCLISENFGRCKSKRTSIVFRMQRDLETSSVSSQILSYSSWTFWGTIGSIILISLLLIILILYKNRNLPSKGPRTPINNFNNFKPHIGLPEKESHRNIPYIDDGIVFDI